MLGMNGKQGDKQDTLPTLLECRVQPKGKANKKDGWPEYLCSVRGVTGNGNIPCLEHPGRLSASRHLFGDYIEAKSCGLWP